MAESGAEHKTIGAEAERVIAGAAVWCEGEEHQTVGILVGVRNR